jgi:choline dehydrogenase-like flavoprotein
MYGGFRAPDPPVRIPGDAMSLNKVNVVIIGSGAGGAVVAKELSEAGLTVALLERGRRHHTEESHHDQLRSHYDNSGPLGYGPGIRAHPRTFRLTPDQPARIRYANEGGYGRTAAALGGGTIAYGCMAWRFVENDFRMATRYGVPPGSTLADWPITYEELEPYYTKAEYDIGISGQAGANPFDPPRSKPYPLPPMPPDRPAEVFMRGARKLGLHPFPLPLAILTAPYDGRMPCIRCLHCERFQCEVDAKSSMHATMIPKAEATGVCEVRTECMVREVLIDDRGRARGVAYFGPDKKLYEQPANLVVVSCNASESPRLLLNSKSKLFPTGAANRMDQVGRHILDHTGGATVVGYFEEEIFEPHGPAFNAGLADYVHRGGAVLGGGVITTLAEFRAPIFFAKHGVSGLGARPWGREAKSFVRQYFRRSLALYSPGQGLPTEQNRVDLDPDVRDAWGIPVVRLTHRVHPVDVRSSQFLRNRMIDILRAAGAIEELLPRPLTDEQIEEAARKVNHGGIGEHQVGGCRMGNDPATSVLNRYCQTHDVDNLFVVDGSCFPTIGGFNPSLTIQANAFRVSDYIKREWKGGAFRG